MTTFNTAGNILNNIALTRVGKRYTDGTNTVLAASGLTAASAIFETPNIEINSSTAVMTFTDVAINLTALANNLTTGLIRVGRINFIRCSIFGIGVFGGEGTITQLAQTADMRFTDCFFAGLDFSNLLTINTRRWRATFIRPRFDATVALQVNFGAPGAGFTLSGTRSNAGQNIAGRIVAPLPESNTNYTPYFDLSITSTAAQGLNFNTQQTGTFAVYNPLTNITYSGRGSEGGTITVTHNRATLFNFTNTGTNQPVIGTIPLLRGSTDQVGILPATFNATSTAPTIGTSTTVNVVGTTTDGVTTYTPVFVRFPTLNRTVTTNAQVTFQISQIVNTTLRHNLYGFRRFNNSGVAESFQNAVSTGIQYLPDDTTVGLFNLDTSTVTPTNVPMIPALYDTTTITQARIQTLINPSPPANTAQFVANTDEIYAASEETNAAAGTILPWEVDEPATFSPGTPAAGRIARTTAPTVQSYYRLKPGIFLELNRDGHYDERDVTRNSMGEPTGGTLHVPLNAVLQAGRRPIRLDGGRQAEGPQLANAGLDTAIIDDYLPAAAAPQPNRLRINFPSTLDPSGIITIYSDATPQGATGQQGAEGLQDGSVVLTTRSLSVAVPTANADGSRTLNFSEISEANFTLLTPIAGRTFRVVYTHRDFTSSQRTIDAVTNPANSGQPLNINNVLEVSANSIIENIATPANNLTSGRTVSVSYEVATNQIIMDVNGCPIDDPANEPVSNWMFATMKTSNDYNRTISQLWAHRNMVGDINFDPMQFIARLYVNLLNGDYQLADTDDATQQYISGVYDTTESGGMMFIARPADGRVSADFESVNNLNIRDISDSNGTPDPNRPGVVSYVRRDFTIISSEQAGGAPTAVENANAVLGDTRFTSVATDVSSRALETTAQAILLDTDDLQRRTPVDTSGLATTAQLNTAENNILGSIEEI